MPFRLPFPDVGRLRGPIRGPEVGPVSLVPAPRLVSMNNGILIDTPNYAPVEPDLEVSAGPYVVDGRMKSVGKGVMVDTPATTIITPERARPNLLEAALAAIGARRE